MTVPSRKRAIHSRVERTTGQSADNAELTVTTTIAEIVRVLFVTVKYSAAVTQNVTVTLVSGAGSAFDVLLSTIVFAPGTQSVFIPDQTIYIEPDDNIVVVAPAGGVGITSAVAIYTEVPL